MSRVSGFRLSRTVYLLVPIFALSAIVYGCSGAQSVGSSDEGDSNVEETSSMTATAEEPTGGDRDSNASGDAGIAITPENRVTLGLDGDEGVRFSGSCTVNDEREQIRGTVPESFDYGLEDGGAVQCVLRKRGGEGTLRISLDSPGGSSVQETNSENGEVRIAMGGNGATSSTSTSSASSSSVVSGQSNSSVTITQNGSSGED